MQMEERYGVSPDIIFTELHEEGEAILLHMKTKIYYTLNETGAEIFRMLREKESSVSDILQFLSEEYQFDGESPEKEIETFLKELLIEKLILRKSGNSQ